MDALTALTTRTSGIALGEPAPSPAEIETILAAAVRAPDHGKLRPWRFLLIASEGRHRLGEVLVEALARREPDAPAPLLQKEREKPLRAPLIVVVVAKVVPDHAKIPEIEQVISAGAAAQNIQLAAHALGYGCMWRTGAAAYDDHVKAALGLAPTDQIVGFMYLGKAQGTAPLRPAAVSDFVCEWSGAVGSGAVQS